MLTVVAIAIWIVLIFSLRISFFGNPTYTIVCNAPDHLIEKAGTCLVEESPPEDDETRRFLATFVRWSIASFVLIVLELGVSVYFMFSDPMFFVPWMIVAKYVILVLFATGIEWEDDATVFEQIQRMPKGLIHSERVVCFLTAIGFIALFIQHLQGSGHV
jgi:hypothetical protein